MQQGCPSRSHCLSHCYNRRERHFVPAALCVGICLRYAAVCGICEPAGGTSCSSNTTEDTVSELVQNEWHSGLCWRRWSVSGKHTRCCCGRSCSGRCLRIAWPGLEHCSSYAAKNTRQGTLPHHLGCCQTLLCRSSCFLSCLARLTDKFLQTCVLQLRAQAAQNAQASGSQLVAAAGGVMRSSSSKIPHLVVGPDGIELFIAHKERIKSALQTDKIHIAPQALVSTVCSVVLYNRQHISYCRCKVPGTEVAKQLV